MNLLIVGRQGAGKGTQAQRLAEWYRIPWVSTGEMFRAAAAAGTEFGKMAKRYMDEGALVPDEVTIGIVKDRLAEPDAGPGVILDGFPRTAAQAAALDAIAPIDLVLNIDVPESAARERMLERAKVEGRADDTPEAIDKRLALYEEQTRPLLGHYGDKVATIDGLGSIDDVFERLRKEVDTRMSAT